MPPRVGCPRVGHCRVGYPPRVVHPRAYSEYPTLRWSTLGHQLTTLGLTPLDLSSRSWYVYDHLGETFRYILSGVCYGSHCDLDGVMCWKIKLVLCTFLSILNIIDKLIVKKVWNALIIILIQIIWSQKKVIVNEILGHGKVMEKSWNLVNRGPYSHRKTMEKHGIWKLSLKPWNSVWYHGKLWFY